MKVLQTVSAILFFIGCGALMFVLVFSFTSISEENLERFGLALQFVLVSFVGSGVSELGIMNIQAKQKEP